MGIHHLQDTRMPDPDRQAHLKENAEWLARLESNARTPIEFARLRTLRHEHEQMIRIDAEGLLPCPECRKWVDVTSGTCPNCQQEVTMVGVMAASDGWIVYLTFALVFTGLAILLGKAAFASDYHLLVKLPAVLLMLASLKIATVDWDRVVRIIAWRYRRSRRPA